MKGLRFLEVIATKYLVLTVVVIIAIIVGSFAIVLAYRLTDVSTLATFVDAVFKTVAISVGCVWALNRYFVSRTDVVQLRVDSDISVVRATEFKSNKHSLLIYRLDVVNTGKSLIPAYSQCLEIESVSPSPEGINYQSLYRWPLEGLHEGGPIEPNSWSAINDATSVPADVKAVRFYLEIHLSKDNVWTWHKTFDISKGKSDG